MSASSWCVTISRYELIAITSHAPRNTTTVRAATTSAIAASSTAKLSWVNQGARRPASPLDAQVVRAEDRAGGADDENDDQEHGGERVDADDPVAARHRAGMTNERRSARGEHTRGGHRRRSRIPETTSV